MRARGFTLVELVVTMIVLGILAIAIVPRMTLLQGFDEVGYRDRVRATIEYARKSAVAQRRAVRVTIASSAVSIDIQQRTPEGVGAGAWVALNLPGSNTNAFVPPAGTTLTPASDTVIFDALGRPDAAKSYVVSGGAGTITVEAESGYVH
jgi:MSHA pilin protein MshC